MEIRAVTEADAPALAALHGGVFPGKGWSAAAFERTLAVPGTFGLLAAQAGAPCGMILARVAGDQADLLTLAVRQEARRRGVARALLALALEHSRGMGARQWFLEVAEDNAAAAALYESLGFRAHGRRRGYYAQPGGAAKDALAMSCALTVG